MIITIASGKGGTGKTTVAVNLACVWEPPVGYVDCDVEEPNGHLFLNPVLTDSKAVGIPVPVVDREKCTGCGQCAKVCRYNALACVKGNVLVFTELCHGCGGCMLVCPERAIAEEEHEIGVVESGYSDEITFIQGRLKVGSAMSPPLIRAVKGMIPAMKTVLLDAPPGTSCPVVATLRDSDFAVLVTEPTPFGLHDLTLAVETVRQVGIPFGVVINRSDIGDGRVAGYCANEGIPVLLEIPENRRIAEAYSRGEIAVRALPEMRSAFARLAREILERSGLSHGKADA